ncbi:cell wall-binding repeat-containing protein [Pseudalkalibacillus caeni]|uniref:Cell wall-binding repeat-containing protein n=1 Tax=Exobacillus caeni TaxID=2574798 RepID=A0A5R9EWH8_9BACL|nr:cell wall-binding repeat-containing protein [Pseudalkalibacillus caeni]TLS35582.1 cell wall-binding repeat-containing protein [Pseudalkalibacillus caeni]
MFKKGSMAVSTLVAAALFASSFATPAGAEDFGIKNSLFEKKKEQVLSVHQQLLEEGQIASAASSSVQATVAQSPTVTFTNEIDGYNYHEYLFDTKGGTFTVVPTHSALEEVDYFIYNVTTEEVFEPSEGEKYDLPAGTYYLTVLGYSEQPVNYQYQLSGPLTFIPDTDLPEINVTKPMQHDHRLPKGSSSKQLVEGTSDGLELFLQVNNKPDILPGGPFSKQVELHKGDNDLLFITENASSNKTWSFYNMTLPGTSRIGGKDRYEVSANVSKTLASYGYDSGTIFISRGDVFADALAGGPLASLETAPVMLTRTDSLTQEVKNQILAQHPYRAVILGGTGSVSTSVEAQLKQLGVRQIERIGGKDRYEVSAKIANELVPYTETDTAYIASGEVFADALSASSVAGIEGAPILLVRKDYVPDSVKTFIKNNPNIKNFVIVGGTATVTEKVSTQLKQLRSGATLDRLAGKDRYEVAVNVAKYGMDTLGMDLSTLVFARGDVFSDALSGSPLAADQWAPILLTRTDRVEDKVNTLLTEHHGETDHIFILGGTGSISTNTESQLSKHIQ